MPDDSPAPLTPPVRYRRIALETASDPYRLLTYARPSDRIVGYLGLCAPAPRSWRSIRAAAHLRQSSVHGLFLNLIRQQVIVRVRPGLYRLTEEVPCPHP